MSSWSEESLGKPPYEGLTNHSLNSVKSAYVCSAQIFIVGSRSVENLGFIAFSPDMVFAMSIRFRRSWTRG